MNVKEDSYRPSWKYLSIRPARGLPLAFTLEEPNHLKPVQDPYIQDKFNRVPAWQAETV
jgi:hypothetical protein